MYIHTEILLKQHQDTENTITFTLHCWYTRHNLKPTIELILSIIILFFNNQIYRYVGTEQWRWRRSGYHFNMRATLCHQHIFTIACRSPQHIISSHTKCPQRTPSMTRRFYCINLGLNKFSSFCCCCFGSKPDFLYITASARAFISPWMSDFSNAVPCMGGSDFSGFNFQLFDELWHFRLSPHMLTRHIFVQQQLLCDYVCYVTTSLMHQWLQIQMNRVQLVGFNLIYCWLSKSVVLIFCSRICF